jgi:tetratricopeptide (TPR) repeat protein
MRSFFLLLILLSPLAFADELIHFTNKNKPLLCINRQEYEKFYTVDTLIGKGLVINKILVKEIEKVKGIFDIYDEKKNAIGLSESKKLTDLATWCIKNQLPEQALKHFEEALKADPKNKTIEKQKAKFEKHLEKEKEKEEEYRLKHQDAFVLRLTYNYEISEELLDNTVQTLKNSNRFLYKITDGYAYLKKVSIELGLDNGDYRVRKDKQNSELGGAKGVTRGSVVFIEENFHEITFVHELGHLKYGIPDEYIPAVRKPCSSCLVADQVFMIQESMNEKEHLGMICDDYIHDGEGMPCWDYLKQKKYRHEGYFLGRSFGEAPEIEIEIIREPRQKK